MRLLEMANLNLFKGWTNAKNLRNDALNTPGTVRAQLGRMG
jgi:hypothetical protein